MFVIINEATGKPIKHKNYYSGFKIYDTEHGAKTGKTAALNGMRGNELSLKVISLEEYKANKPAVKMVERTNLISGKTFLEAEDTPLCCSPASETYWSM